MREFDICTRVASKTASTLSSEQIRGAPDVIAALRARFDEEVVADHLQERQGLTLDLRELFEAMRTLAGETYENRSISLGCILDPYDESASSVKFPEDFFRLKKYKALTDGFRTAYVISSAGRLVRLIDLQRTDPDVELTGQSMFPEWAENIARLSRNGRCGVCLTRAGDFLVFVDGALRFVYRFGRWRYLNNAHIVDLLRNLARVQRVAPARVGVVTKSVYRTALDVSFRRSGGLLVVLRARARLRELVREGDCIDDDSRPEIDRALDGALPSRAIQAIPRRILAELAGLDGALVFANSGQLLAYSAILRPKRQGQIARTEGSRTKAAIGASLYGLVVKISADGGIEVFSEGRATPALSI
ncbi:MAG: hypothetical protein AABM40_03795 [Chloroflexota bacterium]